MVKIALPPPANPPDPIFHFLQPGDRIVRLYDPSQRGASPVTFRRYGPLSRFDHHRLPAHQPGIDPDRGIYYAAFDLASCVVEIFGDTGVIDRGEWHVANPLVTRRIRLLDLRGYGAMRAGSVAAVAKVPDHSLSQEWSRYFYTEPVYRGCDGLIFYNAHNDEQAIALYERAEDGLSCLTSEVIRLDAPAIRRRLLEIAHNNNLIWPP